MTVFFDSHGFAWVTCQPDEPNAAAFGPEEAARRITEDEAAWLHLTGEATHFAAADAQRRVVRDTAAHEFAWLPDGGIRLQMAKALIWIGEVADIANFEAGGGYWPRQVRKLAMALGLPSPIAVEADDDEDDDDDEED